MTIEGIDLNLLVLFFLGKRPTHYHEVIPFLNKGCGEKHGPEYSFLVFEQGLADRQQSIGSITLLRVPDQLERLLMSDVEIIVLPRCRNNLFSLHLDGVSSLEARQAHERFEERAGDLIP